MEIKQAASLMDEGQITINSQWQPVLRIVVAFQDDLDKLASKYGGTVKYSEKHDSYFWQKVGRACAPFVRKVLPHLRHNYQQARVLLDFEELVMDQKAKSKPFARLTTDQFHERLILRDKLLRFNGGYGIDVHEELRKRKSEESMRVRLKSQKAKSLKKSTLEWSAEEQQRIFRLAFGTDTQLQYTELLTRTTKEFKVGMSYAKKVLIGAVNSKIIMRMGRKRSPVAYYVMNEELTGLTQ